MARRNRRNPVDMLTEPEVREGVIRDLYALEKRRRYERAMRLAGRPIPRYDADKNLDRKLEIVKELLDYQKSIRQDVLAGAEKRREFREKLLGKFIEYAKQDATNRSTLAGKKIDANRALFTESAKLQELKGRRDQLSLSSKEASRIEGAMANMLQSTEIKLGTDPSAPITQDQARAAGFSDEEYADRLADGDPGAITFSEAVQKLISDTPENKRHLAYDRLREVALNNDRLDSAKTIRDIVYQPTQDSPGGDATPLGNLIDADRQRTSAELEAVTDALSVSEERARRHIKEIYGGGGVEHLKSYLDAFGFVGEDDQLDLTPEAMEAAVHNLPKDPKTGQPYAIITLQAELKALEDSQDPSYAAMRSRLFRSEGFQKIQRQLGFATPDEALKYLRKDVASRSRKNRRAARQRLGRIASGAEEPDLLGQFLEDDAVSVQEEEQAQEAQAPPTAAAAAVQGSGMDQADAPEQRPQQQREGVPSTRVKQAAQPALSEVEEVEQAVTDVARKSPFRATSPQPTATQPAPVGLGALEGQAFAGMSGKSTEPESVAEPEATSYLSYQGPAHDILRERRIASQKKKGSNYDKWAKSASSSLLK